MKKITLPAFIFPCALILLDYVTNKSTVTFNTNRILAYTNGFIGSIAFWTFYQLASAYTLHHYREHKRVRMLFIVGQILFALVFTATISVSLGYYYEFGNLPNKFAVAYLMDEWTDAVSLITGYISMPLMFLLISVFAAIYACHYFVIRHIAQRMHTSTSASVKKVLAILAIITAASLLGGFFSKKLSATLPMDFGSLQAVAKYAFGDKSGKGYSVPQRIILPENRTAPKPSNVLLIINETLRADFIGYQTLANPIPPASRMTDAIASDSLSFVFKRARSNSSSTRVSLPAILMGMIPTTATSADYHRMPTLWNVSKALGYRTFFITPQNWDWQNLDVFFLNKQVDQSITAKDIGPPYVNNAGVEDRRILDYTNSIFQEFKKNKNPFFGVIQFNCTHQPYNPGDPHTALSPNSTERYAAAVQYLDSLIAQIYVQLNEAGLKDETLIIVTSDHGENFKHRGLARLNNLYDEVIRIPLWVSYPSQYYQTPEGKARFQAWKQNEYSTVQNADIFPTLLSYWGVDKTSLQGYSYQGMRWEDPADSLRILSGTNTGDIRKWNREEFFLLRHHVKFLATDKAGPQIYNLQSDPYEEHNLWDDLSFREAHRPWIHQYISDHAVLAELAKRMKINLGNGAATQPSDTSLSRADIDLK